MRTKCFLKVMLILLMAVGARCLHAQATEPDPDTASAASGPSSALVAPFGAPLAPPIYLTNFSLLYFANPEIAADLPAHRAALPQKVYNCLFENPDGCPYAAMAPFFAEQAAGGGGSPLQKTVWPSSCQTGPAWRGLAPHEERHPFQINQPLGRENADQLAKVLGITEDVILTASEYQCMVGE